MKAKAPHAICDQCPFKDRPIAHSTGPIEADVVVVSRSPGYYEALNGESFAGPSGKVLNHLLDLQGLNRELVRATNVVLCQSDGPTESGWGRAVACCQPRLDAETASASTVLACGSEAVQALTGAPTIARNRGYVHYRSTDLVNMQRVIVTNNPAVVIHDDRTFPELVRDFRLAINPLPAPKLPNVRYTDDVDEAKQWVDDMLGHIEVLQTPGPIIMASDIEARGDKYDELVCAGFATRSERAVVFGEIPCGDTGFVSKHLSRLWEIPRNSVSYLWHNGKYDTKVLRKLGINARVDEDTMLLSWVLDERPGNPESGAGGHSLEWLLKDVLGWPKYEADSVRQFKKDGLIPSKTARRDLYEYNGLDTAGSLALFEVLKQEAINDDVWDRPYKSMLIELSEWLTQIELQGNKFDTERACDLLEEQVWPLQHSLRAKLRRIAKQPKLNPRSPTQLKALMYDQWGLKHKLARPRVERLGKKSTDHYVREAIERGEFTVIVNKEAVQQFAATLERYSVLEKQRGTYFEGLVKRADKDGRIYTDFKIHGTESGRLSSANPNLQNVTRPKEGIPSVRSCFLPDDGCVFISADLSQAELRTIAVLSGDKHLQSIYTDTGRSLHKEVAEEFYGENYTYEEYVRAKNINFGVAYWQSAFSFAQLYHMEVGEAQRFINMWWERFPQVYEWTKEIERQVTENGELQSPFGHKRRFYVIPADESARLHTIKQGINFIPQNIAANITLWGLISLCKKIDWRYAQPRITVHDSILVNCRQEHTDEVAHLMKECLENAPRESIGWNFPYKADLSVGNSWSDMNELTERERMVSVGSGAV